MSERNRQPKTHTVYFHGRTYCGLSAYLASMAGRPLKLADKPTCKRCLRAHLEWLCMLAQGVAEILDERRQPAASSAADRSG